MLKEFIKKFTEVEIVKDFVTLKTEYFEIPQDLENIRKKINRQFVHAGKFLGVIKKEFIPSSWLLQEIAKFSENKIWLNEKGEWLFICGRDVMKKSVVKISDKLVENQLVLVLNQHDECLGYGYYSDKKIVIKNVFDLGDFLRRERH
ncbi:hypothetical protein HYV79_05090 [Candidatus Woesearchaeota archaeon]|nr:hypothetical protein [Candidatus Woesearchaeota archaeon]